MAANSVKIARILGNGLVNMDTSGAVKGPVLPSIAAQSTRWPVLSETFRQREATNSMAQAVEQDVSIDLAATHTGVRTVESFDEFVGARSPALLRTAYLLTRDHALAEDLVQTALAKAWFHWSRIKSDDPEPYVRRILVTTYSAWWRRRWTGEIPTEELPETPAPPGEDGIDLWDALGRLPRRQRAVLVLRFYEDLTEAETARLMGCSVGTVKSQASKALAKLRLDPALASGAPASQETPR
jgi:RNA polymerase sigma-70 factor (sigma-E family)